MKAGEEPRMSGASIGWGRRYGFDEDGLDEEFSCESRLGWESLEGRLVELGLS
jgi:hypothetical protein